MSIVGLDTFSEASANVALTSHQPEIGATWSVEVAQFTVAFVADRLQHNRNALDHARKGDNIGDDNHTVTAVLSVGAAARIAGVCARMSTDGYTNQYEATLQYLNATTQEVRLFKNISGTRSQIGATATVAIATNVECELRLEIGTGTQQIFINGVLTVDQTEPDATLAGRYYAGLCMNGNNAATALISSFQSESVAVSDLAAFVTGQGDLTGAALTTNITMAAALSGAGTIAADLNVGLEWVLSTSSSPTSSFTGGTSKVGNTYALLVSGSIVGARFWRDDGILFGGELSHVVELWDAAQALTATSNPSVETSGYTGWVEVTFPTPIVETTAGQEWTVSVEFGACAIASPPVQLADAARATFVTGQFGDPGPGFPNLGTTTANYLIDINWRAAGVSSSFGAVTLTGTGAVAAALTTNVLLAATLPGTGTLNADLTTGGSSSLGSATVSGTGDVIAALTTDILVAATVPGTGNLSAAITTDITLAAPLLGSGDVLNAALTTNLTMAAVLTGTGTLEGTVALPVTLTLAGALFGTGELRAALSGGHALLRFATYDIYIGTQLVELGVLDDTSVTVSLTDTYTGSRQFGAVTVRLGLGRGPDVAALFENATKGAGLRIYRYDATTSLQTLVFDGIVNTLELDTTALVVGGVQAPVKILEMKIPVELLKTPPWPATAPTESIGVPIPDLFGNVPRTKCVCVNRDRINNLYDYVICRSRWPVNVPAMYRSASSSDGKNQVTLITASEYQVTTWMYPGYVTARFAVEQIDFSGGAYTIYADVTTNPDFNISRNAVKILRTYLLEAAQPCVAASWDAAEAEFTRLGYVLDFSLTDQIQLQELATDIGLMLDSTLERTSQGWTFTPDVRPTTVDYQFTEGTAELTPTIVDISPVSLSPLLDETSMITVKYLPDMLDPSKYLGSVSHNLSTSPHASPLELTFPWIRDWSVADRIADYKLKQIKTRDRSLTITGPRVAALPIRSLVTVTSPRRQLTNAIYMVKSLQQSVLGQPQLDCVSWSPDPYIYEAGPVPKDLILGTAQDFSRVPPPIIADITFPAGAPYEGVEIGPAGAMKAFVTMRFITPTGGNYLYAVVRYRLTSSVLWVPTGGPITQLGTVDVKIRNLEPQVSYDFSAQSFNQWGLTAGGE